jgi:integrase
MTGRKNPFPGVTRAVSRHGKVQFRFRKGSVDTYLPGAYGSAEFRAAYEAAVKGSKSPAIRSTAAFGSLEWLIEAYLRSSRYLDLSPGRRESLRGLLDFLRGEAGDLPFGRMAPKHVEALMGKKAGPVAANNVKKTLSILFNFAIKYELADQKTNPARHADRRKEQADGFHTWTDAEIAKFLDHHGPGTKARRALMLFLCTGAARQDAAAMGWQNVKDDRISYRRGKTGVEADLRILPELAAELAHVPKSDLLFLTHGRGRAYGPDTLGNWFKDQCIAAGLPHCTAHGLRKAGATRLADAGASEWEVMAFLAHKTPKEAATYTKKAGRARLADGGFAKLTGSKPERNVSNLAKKLDKGGA